MDEIFETLENNYIEFGKSQINVIIDDNEKLWFNAIDVTHALGYIDSRDAIRTHTSITDRKALNKIKYSIKIKKHPQSIYLSEAGLYKLILRSKMKTAKKFSDWVTNDVLPSIRKYGNYKMKKDFEKQRIDLMERINYLEKINKQMHDDMKKEKYPDGAVVYAIDYSDEDDTLDGIFRIGKATNMTTRKKIYNTHMLHNKEVIVKRETNDPILLEYCIRGMLYKYRYKDRKDFYICNKQTIIKAFKNCIKSEKNMNQVGGSTNLVKIVDELKNIENVLNEDLRVLNKQIKDCDNNLK